MRRRPHANRENAAAILSAVLRRDVSAWMIWQLEEQFIIPRQRPGPRRPTSYSVGELVRIRCALELRAAGIYAALLRAVMQEMSAQVGDWNAPRVKDAAASFRDITFKLPVGEYARQAAEALERHTTEVQ